jgi:hypothetical protein
MLSYVSGRLVRRLLHVYGCPMQRRHALDVCALCSLRRTRLDVLGIGFLVCLCCVAAGVQGEVSTRALNMHSVPTVHLAGA